MKDKQQMRFTDTELSLIKNTFSDNGDLIVALRKLFLQMPMDTIDRNAIKNIRNNRDVLNVLRKTFLPKLDPNAPSHQLIDLWLTLNLKDKTPEHAFPDILSREMLIDYLEQQFEVLEFENTRVETLLNDMLDIEGKTPLEVYVGILTRNTAISHIELMLSQLVMLAGKKSEGVEETKKRLQKDSAK